MSKNTNFQNFEEHISSLIKITEDDLSSLKSRCTYGSFKKKDILRAEGELVQEIYFLINGILRLCITDDDGQIHTTHFAVENQFIADYTALITGLPAKYSLEALEDSEIVILPKSALDWFYKEVEEGEKLGRLIWDDYFIYLDNRIQHMYTLSAKARYDIMQSIFPNIHQRVPQHMIASYIGISNVHLSRIKKEQL